MAQLVNVPGVGQLSFPDGMSQDDMAAAIQRNFPQIHQPAQEESFTDRVGHQLGLTVRAGVNGVMALPAMVSDAVTGPINAGMDLTMGKGNGPRFTRAAQAVNDLMDAAGVAQPQNAQERIVQDAASAIAGVGTGAGIGKVLSGTGNATAQAVGDMLQDGLGLQATSAATSAGAASDVREHGGGAGAQTLAAVAGALAPMVPTATAAAVRGALRGSDVEQAAQNLAHFDAAGVSPTLGQVTQNKLIQSVESLLNKTPGGAGVMRNFADQQADDMAQAVQRLSDELAPGASAANAGEAITRGVTTFKDGIKAIQQKLYGTLDNFIPAETPIPVTNTQAALSDLTAGIPGAPNLSQFFVNSKMAGLDAALVKDMEQASTGALPYDAIKRLRTLVGNEITDHSLVSDVPRAQWKYLYSSLSNDLGAAAKAAGPQAEQTWQWANQFTKSQLGRLEDLSGIVSKDSPEKIFNAAISGTAEGDTIVKRVIDALPMQERREVAAAVLQRLGRAAPGQQNAMGDAFSSEAFLSNLSKLSPQAKQTIFGRTDLGGVLGQIEHYAHVADFRRMGGKVFANGSGTASAAAQMGVAGSIGAGVVAATQGHMGPLMAALTVPATAWGAAKAVTSPTLRRLATTATTPLQGAQAAAVRIPSIMQANSVDQAIQAARASVPDVQVPIAQPKRLEKKVLR